MIPIISRRGNYVSKFIFYFIKFIFYKFYNFKLFIVYRFSEIDWQKNKYLSALYSILSYQNLNVKHVINLTRYPVSKFEKFN